MIKYVTKVVESTAKESITCDVCKREFLMSDDFLEIQEFFSWNMIGGYSSVFGDGNEIVIDICQHCFKKKLGDYIVINGEKGI